MSGRLIAGVTFVAWLAVAVLTYTGHHALAFTFFAGVALGYIGLMVAVWLHYRD